MTRVWMIGAVLALSACVSTPSVSPDAGPGAEPAVARAAAGIFDDACVRTLPDFAAAPQALAEYPFVQHATFGTYYHRRNNLSVKLTGDTCSMVMGIAGDPNVARTAFVTALSRRMDNPDTPITLTGRPGPDGLFYFTVRTNASQ